jgi:phosphomannomutase/phosphoglucomutase
VIGFDAFRSSWDLQDALVRGLSAEGIEVIHLGLVPTPLLHHSAARLGADGAVFLAGGSGRGEKTIRLYTGGSPLSREDLVSLLRTMEKQPGAPLLPLRGRVRYINVIPDYLRDLEREFATLPPLLRRFPAKVVVGANHGPASMTAPSILLRLGCRVVKLACTVEARGRCEGAPYDSAATVWEVGMVVRAARADFGVSFDREGRRITVVDSEGERVPAAAIDALLATEETRLKGGEDGTYGTLRMVDLLTRSRANLGRNTLLTNTLQEIPSSFSWKGASTPGQPPRGKQ